jgi:hypothetical protein
VINNIAVPQNFFSPTDKSWDLKAIDTIEIWRANSTNGDSTLGTVMCVNGFENPKEDLSGKDLTSYYYSDDFDIQRVINYCERDVKAVRDLVVKLQTGLIKYT